MNSDYVFKCLCRGISESTWNKFNTLEKEAYVKLHPTSIYAEKYAYNPMTYHDCINDPHSNTDVINIALNTLPDFIIESGMNTYNPIPTGLDFHPRFNLCSTMDDSELYKKADTIINMIGNNKKRGVLSQEVMNNVIAEFNKLDIDHLQTLIRLTGQRLELATGKTRAFELHLKDEEQKDLMFNLNEKYMDILSAFSDLIHYVLPDTPDMRQELKDSPLTKIYDQIHQYRLTEDESDLIAVQGMLCHIRDNDLRKSVLEFFLLTLENNKFYNLVNYNANLDTSKENNFKQSVEHESYVKSQLCK